MAPSTPAALPQRTNSTTVVAACHEAKRLCVKPPCISNGRYCLSYFKQFVAKGDWYFFNDTRVLRNLDKLDWNHDDLAKVLMGLHSRHCQKNVSNCIVNELDGYETIDSDQYEVHWDHDENRAKPYPQTGTVSLSLKISIVDDDCGEACGVVTFHTSGAL